MIHHAKLLTLLSLSLSLTRTPTQSILEVFLTETHGQTDMELHTSAAEGMLPLGLVTMLFLVLFVWGCAGNTKCYISAQQQW